MVTSDYNYLKDAIQDFLGDKLIETEFNSKYTEQSVRWNVISNYAPPWYFSIPKRTDSNQIRGRRSGWNIPEYIELLSGFKFYRYDKK